VKKTRHDKKESLHSDSIGTETALVVQMEMSSLLALHATDRTIGSSPVGLSVQRHPDGKSARHLVPDDLDGANGLAPGPLSDGLQALLSQSAVT
jgi:hypothetical protein